MSEHRVPMLGGAWRRLEDPERSRDPRVRAVVAALSAVPAPPMRAEFRDELRAQLVAITPRIVAEAREADAPMATIVPRPEPLPARAPGRRPSPGPSAAPAPVRTHHTPGALDRLRGIRLGRPLAIVASVVTVFALLLGGAVWMSRKALPGDSLYGLKRASERFELATAGSDSERASDYLTFAASRAQEVRALLSRAGAVAAGSGLHAGGISAGTADLVTSTLASADSDVRAASVILTRQAAQGGSKAPLQTMLDWTPAQLSRLQAVQDALPAGALRDRITSSADLVGAAQARARALQSRLGCSCLSGAPTDSLGVIPCDVCSVPTVRPSAPSGSQPATRSGTPAGNAGSSSNAPLGPTPDPVTVTPSGFPPVSGSGSPSGGGSSSSGGGILPPLPPITSVLPVKSSSCGIGASLGPIGIGIGLCPISVGISLHP